MRPSFFCVGGILFLFAPLFLFLFVCVWGGGGGGGGVLCYNYENSLAYNNDVYFGSIIVCVLGLQINFAIYYFV